MMCRPLLLLSILCHHFAEATGWSWSKVSISNTASNRAPSVSGQATASSIHKNSVSDVLLFGGLTGAAGAPTTNDLWEFDSTKDEWTKFLPDNDDGARSIVRPRVRMYAASAMMGNKFYIFGGWDPMEPGSGGEFLDNIWSFDRTTKAWSEEKAKLPFPVSRHAGATVMGDNSGDDVVIIHTYKGILTFRDGLLTEQATDGDAPESLSMCAMTAIGNKVVLFGGSDKNQCMSSEVYVLDTTNWTWTKLDKQYGTTEEGPAAMASASMAPLNREKCIVFGGAGLAPTGYEGGYGLLPKDDTWICTVSERNVEWERVECAKRPEGRVAASLNKLGDGRFLLQGGYDPVSKATFEEPWILSTD